MREFEDQEHNMDDKKDLQSLLSQTKSGKQLSEYHMKLLKKQKISTPQEFVDAPNLHKLMALGVDQVELIKRELLSLLVKSVTLKKLYQTNPLSFSTGIEEVDKLLDYIGQPLRPGRVWELYGETGVGKTEFLHTLAVNFVANYRDRYEVLFIDTKRDFDSERVHEILLNRQLDNEAISSSLIAINVIESTSAESLIGALETMLVKLSTSDDTVSRIKLVLVDSLAASFILYRSSYERNNGRSFLTKLAMIVRTLASQHGIAFILGNLSLSSNDEFDDDEDNDACMTPSSPDIQEDFTLLGDYWDSVCTLALTLEIPEESNSDGIRMLKVLNNSYGVSGNSCFLRITDAGVI
ncbi:DNA repair protein RAD51 [Drosophila innubila]|uniref:DNA repair protein RAD51 n=1 Tax=Drosophila innubila TaxID=198719 RepID=UPI00148C7650|nr:DNA repair protein RAD51 [Drosophila innubila]